MKLTCEEITTALRVLNEVRTESAGNPLYGFEDNFDDFVTELFLCIQGSLPESGPESDADSGISKFTVNQDNVIPRCKFRHLNFI